ncbi:GNAT family N-acetyltransferase [Leadbettera azotonutricia]|uniref:Uncharacterized protein n=1 Tax=Leadbettera azotonutricia (strain ATCC BAA-888 / DSM 13862 / ZAS-9) TaxID=545695 RepID=F5Y770_LEAAZ|nr:GNAT family N-acetyltransferase [Leadbettera azotonutricia]AEF80822.1 conserved hypothetical protein [Leadbettera azotonutricia ZAS-9]
MELVTYDEKYESLWDGFIKEESVNGEFMHTRNFLNYHHKGKFTDCSFLIYDGANLAAVIPACERLEDGEKIYFSHGGASFGGFVIGRKYYNAKHAMDMVKALEDRVRESGFTEVHLKMTPDLFCREKSDLLQFVLMHSGYAVYADISTFIDFADYKENIEDNFDGRQKRNYKAALKFGPEFREITDDTGIISFYRILVKNHLKFEAVPAHTLDELYEICKRLGDSIKFFGVFLGGTLCACSMVLEYKYANILHTQYLAMDYDYALNRPSAFLYYNLIDWARKCGFSKLSWGVSSNSRGAFLNDTLLSFKESVGSRYSLNRGFTKKLR